MSLERRSVIWNRFIDGEVSYVGFLVMVHG